MERAERRDGAAGRAAAGAGRAGRAWRALDQDQRLAGIGALLLFVTMFLPWYDSSKPVSRVVDGRLQADTATQTHSAISVFTFVEAAVLLVAIAVLVMLFARAERRGFHLPGGDGTVVTAAGAWVLLLVVWRFFDKPDLGANATVGLAWGILGPLAAGGLMTYAGLRMRAAHRPEPPLPDLSPDAPGPPARRTAQVHDEPRTPSAGSGSGAGAGSGAEAAPTRRVTAEEAPTRRVAPEDAPTRRVVADEAPTKRVPRGDRDHERR